MQFFKRTLVAITQTVEQIISKSCPVSAQTYFRNYGFVYPKVTGTKRVTEPMPILKKHWNQTALPECNETGKSMVEARE